MEKLEEYKKGTVGHNIYKNVMEYLEIDDDLKDYKESIFILKKYEYEKTVEMIDMYNKEVNKNE